MKDYLWIDRHADGTQTLTDDPSASVVVVAPSTPAVVRLPPELGSAVVRVIRRFSAACVICGESTTHLELEHAYFVCTCFSHINPYMFYSRKR